ncbi:uncharacterized protein I303_107974 [Kwoniella dejecticola CBS 10117]|uniref:Uncharacterized protein n=1 Tax=Kwoniella dejecticola CBS 10117 TaxID=1296121 RepID=A0A1A5ZW66_9TREE|nr:uncharacterized protein I303_07967 [Kwoniella dejecticola CBS 10117]OBR82053.1 hypothetical protein I303_07967 [Kwoniella dejecticola CBS 10117]
MSSSSSSAKPSCSSSSSSKPSSSSSSSSSRPSGSGSSSRPSSSSSSGGSSGGSGSGSAPPQPVPTISANAWMSFFLFCCLVLIILQGPLGLTGPGNSLLPGFPGVPSIGGMGMGMNMPMPGCAGVVSGYVPWCQPQPQVAQAAQPQPQFQVQQVVQNPPTVYNGAGAGVNMGGQGGFASPNGGGGWSWYSNGGGPVRQPVYHTPQQRSVQYQRPGLQIQVNQARGGGGGGGFPQPGANVQSQYMGSPQTAPPQGIPIQPVPVPVTPPPPVMPASPSAIASINNLENAFYPLLVGAIALLVVFDYAS